MKTEDLTITGLLFTGVVLLATWIYEDNKAIDKYLALQSQHLSLQSNYIQAQELVIDIYDENNSLHNSLAMLNNHIDGLEDLVYSGELVKLIKIKEDLRSYSVEERATALAIAWTESTWRLNPYHNDNGFTVGPCGVKEYHIEYLADKNIDRYSFASCIEMYKLYKDKHSGSKDKAIKAYKGIVTKTYLVEKYNNIRDKILNILKD